MTKIRIEVGDITKLKVDAIVNAANSSLLGGGGVDGAIHKAAGSELLEACKLLKGCKTGEAKLTKGYKLPAKYIIHAVGPIWRGGDNNEKGLLVSCYRNCLDILVKNGLTSIAFPNISTGVYGFPKQLAAELVITEIESFVKENIDVKEIVFSIFDEENLQIYTSILNK